MCWSGEASAVVAAVGLGSTAYAMYKREPLILTSTLGYFSLMELLQAVSYTVVDQCGTPLNESMTLLAYLHISFQPFVINAFAMYFIAADARRRAAPWVYSVCFAAAAVLILNIYPFPWAGLCEALYREMCSTRLCSYYGKFHIAWEFSMNGMLNWMKIEGQKHINAWMLYVIPVFVMPLLYGSWRMTIYLLLIGPIPAIAITGRPNEMAAFWCLESMMIVLIVMWTPLRRMLFVDKWFWWQRPAGEPHEHDRWVAKAA